MNTPLPMRSIETPRIRALPATTVVEVVVTADTRRAARAGALRLAADLGGSLRDRLLTGAAEVTRDQHPLNAVKILSPHFEVRS